MREKWSKYDEKVVAKLRKARKYSRMMSIPYPATRPCRVGQSNLVLAPMRQPLA